MRTFTFSDAKNNFGELIDMAKAAPVAITKYDRPVVVVLAPDAASAIVSKVPQSRNAEKFRNGRRRD